MKIKEGFILREVAGSFIVVAVGEAVKTYNGLITLNETSAFLWNLLVKGATEDEVVGALLGEYEVEKEDAVKGVKSFINKLVEAKLVI